jgi:hypothetical protein
MNTPRRPVSVTILAFCAVIAWILFRSQATRYFRSGRKGLFTSAPS